MKKSERCLIAFTIMFLVIFVACIIGTILALVSQVKAPSAEGLAFTITAFVLSMFFAGATIFQLVISIRLINQNKE